jgi:dTDP-4-dehydrorhamnose reductase
VRVLILGGGGMLGHRMWQDLKNRLDVYITVRDDFSEIKAFGIFNRDRTFHNVNVLDFKNLEKKTEELRPDVIINCIGIVKQISEAHDAIKSIEINSLFPHRLEKLCARIDSRLIHISTDCVFSGKKGNYNESDIPDPTDLYGRTKLLGEVDEGNVLTLRTSLIGRELRTKHGLLEWFLSQDGKIVKGYTKAIFSGFPTLVFSRILTDIIMKHKQLRGVYHVSSYPISKFDLLRLIKKTMNLNIEITPEDDFCCDRSLDSSRFSRECSYAPLSWEAMIQEMVNENKGRDV